MLLLFSGAGGVGAPPVVLPLCDVAATVRTHMPLAAVLAIAPPSAITAATMPSATLRVDMPTATTESVPGPIAEVTCP